jgi:hypothetical protein
MRTYTAAHALVQGEVYRCGSDQEYSSCSPIFDAINEQAAIEFRPCNRYHGKTSFDRFIFTLAMPPLKKLLSSSGYVKCSEHRKPGTLAVEVINCVTKELPSDPYSCVMHLPILSKLKR